MRSKEIYGPVSILPVISKISEILIFNNITLILTLTSNKHYWQIFFKISVWFWEGFQCSGVPFNPLVKLLVCLSMCDLLVDFRWI